MRIGSSRWCRLAKGARLVGEKLAGYVHTSATEMKPPQQHIDLTADMAVTAALLARPLEWRVRVVEHVEVDSATSCLRRRSLQSLPLRSLLPADSAQAAEGAVTALMVLNVASVPRGALLDLDVSGPEDVPAFLLPRGEIARREADYLRATAGDAGLTITSDLLLLLEGVVGYTETGWHLDTPAGLKAAARDYLSDGFGQELSDAVVQSWLDLDRRIATRLAPYTEPGPGLSPTEHPILGLPSLADELDFGSSDWPARAEQALKDYLLLVEGALSGVKASEVSAAGDLLRSLADYGRNYDMLVVTKVPLDEPFLLKYSERRSLSFSWWRDRAEQDLIISDALSNHIVLSVEDPNVRIAAVRAKTAQRNTDAFGAFNKRQSDQTYAVYAHDPDRDYEITLQFRLAPLRRLQYVIYVVATLLLLLTAALIYESPRELRELALIVGPSALAASALLNREPSTLGSHLRRRSTTTLSAALLLLLLVGAGSYLWPHLPEIWAAVRAALSAVGGMFR